MKRFNFQQLLPLGLMILFSLSAPSTSSASTALNSTNEIIGHWKFTSMIYKGQEMPPVSPDLNLRWDFFENGTERLYWDHGDARYFCERFGSFSVQNGFLLETALFLNPKNESSCSQDPDMKLPRETKTPIAIVNGKIHLQLPLGDEILIYILSPIQ